MTSNGVRLPDGTAGLMNRLLMKQPPSSVLTVVAARSAGPLAAGDVRAMRDAIAELGGTPGRVRWLAPGAACALPVDGLAARAAERAGLDALGGRAIDVIATPANRQTPALMVADMDATIVDAESLDELALEAGIKDKIAPITERAMRGEIDFADALRARVALLEGLDAGAIQRTLRRLRLMPGARTLVRTLKAHGVRTVLVSGGFSCFVEPMGARAGFDRTVANRLVVSGGTIAGTVAEPILDKNAKRAILQEEARAMRIPFARTIAIGDGANDIPMLRQAGLGIAFHGKPAAARAAKARVRHGDLTTVLFALGIPVSAFRR